MQRTTSSLRASLLAVTALFLLVLPIQAFTESYCSSQNTAPDNTYYSWPYQSNGNCTNHCNSDLPGPYAFAVIQFQECWCSNYIPSQQTSTSRCDVACPGYPAENCGSKDDGLYIYIELSGRPSGTAGAAQSSSTVSSVIPSSPSSTPAQSSSSSSSTETSTTSKSSVTQQSSQSRPTPQESVTLITDSGSGNVVTRTVTYTPSDAPTSSAAPVITQSSSSNTGAIAGGVVGGVVGLAAIVGGIWFFLMRRRQKQRQMHDELNSAGIGGGSSGITRNTSTMSQAGLLGRGGGSANQYPAPIVTNFGTANSRYGDQDSISPNSNRRNSQPMVIDSRLNPKAVLTFGNASRESLASMDDSRDYGRQLNVRNPDP